MKVDAIHAAVGAALAGSFAHPLTGREQNLQEVPVSIVAITGDSLELQGLDSLEDVGNYIQNINIQGGGAGTYGPQFRVRGLPNVGLYIDGVSP
jgi:iron complex outermembrane receptor protein